MADRKCGVMLIPTPLPILPETAHLTMVYAGDGAGTYLISQLSTLVKFMATRVDPFAAMHLGVNPNFGDDKDEPVLTFGLTPELTILRSMCARYSQSSYDALEWRPHIAVPEIQMYLANGWRIPRHFYFSRLEVWLDNEVMESVYLGTGTST